MPVKSLKVSVKIAIFSYIFLMTMETADLSAYHDLGPKHFDSGQLTVVPASPKKPDFQIQHDITKTYSLASPQILFHILSPLEEKTWHTTFTPVSQFPSRASLAYLAQFTQHTGILYFTMHEIDDKEVKS
jgi:hypothetical protein